MTKRKKKIARAPYVKVQTPWRQFCDMNGLKYNWVAGQLGITTSLMKDWLQGRKAPEAESAQAVAVSVFVGERGSSFDEVFQCD